MTVTQQIFADGARAHLIEKSGPQLMWAQVAQDLSDLIASGKVSSGHKLPSAEDLGLCYGVSRITVRRAVLELKEKGLVTVVKGRGTFVR